MPQGVGNYKVRIHSGLALPTQAQCLSLTWATGCSWGPQQEGAGGQTREGSCSHDLIQSGFSWGGSGRDVGGIQQVLPAPPLAQHTCRPGHLCVGGVPAPSLQALGWRPVSTPSSGYRAPNLQEPPETGPGLGSSCSLCPRWFLQAQELDRGLRPHPQAGPGRARPGPAPPPPPHSNEGCATAAVGPRQAWEGGSSQQQPGETRLQAQAGSPGPNRPGQSPSPPEKPALGVGHPGGFWAGLGDGSPEPWDSWTVNLTSAGSLYRTETDRGPLPALRSGPQSWGGGAQGAVYIDNFCSTPPALESSRGAPKP